MRRSWCWARGRNEAADIGEDHGPSLVCLGCPLAVSTYAGRGRAVAFGYAIGPIRERGEPTGLIIHRGYVVAEWGEPLRVDMTHSVTKSFLSSLVGIAFDRGAIKSIDDPVRDYVAPIQLYEPNPSGNKSDRIGRPDLLFLFETPHNRTITWDHLLRQTSDWEGTLWGKPDWADRPDANAVESRTRQRNAPGTVYKYNDTRVNVLALAALNVWRRPMPRVLKETIMDPIGASSTTESMRASFPSCERRDVGLSNFRLS